MRKAKPKKSTTYYMCSVDGNSDCFIKCRPYQKWDFEEMLATLVHLSRKGTSFIISKEDFEQNWKVVE